MRPRANQDQILYRFPSKILNKKSINLNFDLNLLNIYIRNIKKNYKKIKFLNVKMYLKMSSDLNKDFE